MQCDSQGMQQYLCCTIVTSLPQHAAVMDTCNTHAPSIQADGRQFGSLVASLNGYDPDIEDINLIVSKWHVCPDLISGGRRCGTY